MGFLCLLIKELLHISSHGKKLNLSQNSNNASASHSWAIIHCWWRPNGIRERPPERSVTKIDPMWVWFVLKLQYQKCEPRGGFRFDILAHSCCPFSRRVCHVSSGELAASPHPSGKTGNMTEFRFTPKLKSNPPSVYKMCHYVIMSHKKTQHVLSVANMSELPWTVFIWRFYLTGQQEVGGGLRRGLRPLSDHYLQMGQTTMSIKMDGLRRVHSPRAHLFATWLPFQEGFYSCGFTFEIQTASNWKGFGDIKLFLNHSNDGISEWLVGRRLCP